MKRIYNIITSLMLLAILGVLGTSNTYAAAPTVSARNLSFSNIQSTTATIGWINGNGTGRLVVVFPNSTAVATIDAAVTDGTIYTGNTAYGSGASISTGYAVYRGTGSTRTVNVTGLSAGTEYNVKVYEYKNDGGTDPEYRTIAGTNNPRSFTTVFTPPTNLATTSITAQGWTAGWDDILVDGYEIRITNDMDVVISGWDNIDIGDIVTYDVTNLMNGTNYKWSVRAYNGNSYSAYATYLTVTTLTDNTPPTITSVGVSDAVISEADAAATFTITLTFNEDMDNGIDPVITFNADVSTTLTNGSGYWQDQRIYTRNYTIADVNEYANGVDVIVNSAKDVAGNTMAQHTETDEFSVDMLAPTAFTVGSVLTSDGTVVAGYYNASNDGLDVTVPIASDNSLTGGTIQIQAKIGANNFENIGVSNTIFVENLNATQSVSLTDANIMGITDFAENAVISFRAIITDNVGNSTTGAASNTTITNDQVAPSAPTPTFTSNATGSFTGFYNANVTGINISYTVPNEVGGGYTVRVIQSNPALSVGFPLLAAGGTIVAPVVEMPTNTNTNFNQATEVASIDISDGDLTTAGFVNNNGDQDPYSMYSYVVITDAAGNSTTGANSTLVAIEEIRPTVTITRNAITIGEVGGFRTKDATISFDIDFTKQVSNFGIADITVNDPGAATFDVVEAGDLVVDNLGAGEYTFTITNVAGDGDLGITLVKTDFTDAAGNELAENAVSSVFTIDNTAPTVTSIKTTTDATGVLTNATSVTYTITFSEDIVDGSFVAGDDLTLTVLSGTLASQAITSVTKITETTYDVVVGSYTGAGELRLNFIGLVTDLATNVHNDDDFTGGQTYIIDRTPPTVTSINRQSPASQITNSASVTYRITFSEDLSDASFVAGDDLILTEVSGTLDLQEITSVTKITETTYDVVVGNYTGTGELRLEFTGLVTDLAGNVHNGDNFTSGQTYLLDRDEPVAPAISSLVSVGGTVVSGYYNSTNTDITLQFTLPNDPTLVYDAGKGAGTYTVGYTLDGVSYNSLNSPNHTNVHILADDMDDLDGNVAEIGKLQTITITEAQLNAFVGGPLADGATINFKVNLQDRAYNNAAGGFGAAAAQSITVDQTAPTAPTPSFTSVGTGSFTTYYNTFATGTTSSFVLPNDASLNGGNYTLQILDDDNGEWIDITAPDYQQVAIGSTPDGTASTTTALSDAQLDAINGAAQTGGLVGSDNDDNLIRVRVVLTDVAGNTTTSTQSAAITVDETVPTITTVARVADDNPTIFSHFNPTGLYNRRAFIGHDITFSEVVTMATNLYHITAIAPATRTDGVNNNSTPDVIGLEGGPYLMGSIGDLAPSPSNRWVLYALISGNGGLDIHLDAVNNSTNVYDVAGNPPVEPDIVNIGTVENPNNQGYITLTTFAGENAIIMDNIVPTVTITRDGATTTNANSVSFTLDFSEAVDLVFGDITVDDPGAATFTAIDADDLVVLSAPNHTYTLTITGVDGDGDLGITVDETVADLAGNPMAADVVSALFTIDNTLPTVTITRNAVTNGSNFVTNDNTVSFDIDFSEQVQDFTIADIAINVTGVTPADLTGATLTIDNASLGEYTLTIPSVAGDGTLGITINNAAFTDLASNQMAMNSVSALFTIDNMAPTAANVTGLTSVGAPVVAGYYNGSNTGITFTFDIPNDASLVGGTYTVQYTIDGTTFIDLTSPDYFENAIIANNSIADANIGEIGTTQTISLNEAELDVLATTLANGDILNFRVELIDLAGNETIGGEGTDILVDQTAPTVSITRNAVTLGSFAGTTDNSVSFTLDYSEAVNLVFSNISVDDPGAATFTALDADDLAVLSAPNHTYTLTITGVDGNGTLGITVGAGVTDLAGNGLVIDGTVVSELFTIDNNPPAAFTTGSVLTAGGTVVAGYYNASNTGINVTVPIASDVTLTGGTIQIQARTGMNAFANVGSSGTILVDNLNGTQSVSLTNANVIGISGYAEDAVIEFLAIITDNAGNPTTGTASLTTITVDRSAPTAANVTNLTSVGNPVVANFYNGANTGVSFEFTIPNDASLVGGTYTVQFTTNNGTNWANITAPNYTSQAVIANDMDDMDGNVGEVNTTQTISLSEAELITLSGGTLSDGEVLNFRVILTDVAGNQTTGTGAGTGITVAQTGPNLVVADPGSTCQVAGTAFDLTLTVTDAAFASVKENYTASLVTIGALTVNSVSRTGTAATLNVTIPTNANPTGVYALTVTLTEGVNITSDNLQTVKFSSGTATTVKIVASGADAEYPLDVAFGSLTTYETSTGVCADGSSTFDFKYVTSISETSETVVVKKNGVTTLATPADYSINTTTNTISIVNGSVANGDLITVELTGPFACGTITSNSLTIVKNPLPTAAVLTDNSTTNSVCYNASVAFTADGGNTSGFNYTWERSLDGGTTYAALNAGADVVLSGTGNSIVTVSNIAANFGNPNTFRVRSIKTNATTFCATTSSASDLITINKETSSLLATGSTNPKRGTGNITYSISAPANSVVTSYEWRVLNSAGTVMTTQNPTTDGVTYSSSVSTETNTIAFGPTIPFAKYYIQVRAITTCGTPAWPSTTLPNAESFEVEITRTPSAIGTFARAGTNTMQLTWSNVAGNYDGKIILVTQSNLNNTTHMQGAITIDGGGSFATVISNLIAPTEDYATTGSTNVIRYGGNAPTGSNLSPADDNTKYMARINDNTTTSKTFTVPANPGSTTLRYHVRLVDFVNTTTPTDYNLTTQVYKNGRNQNKIGIEGETEIVGENTISAISPNPAKDFIAFDMNLVESTNVTIVIYSMEGREVLRFVDGKMFGAGSHNINIPLRDFISGAYGISISFGQEAIFETFMVMP